MNVKQVEAAVRQGFGKAYRNSLKAQSKVPGVLYSGHIDPVAIEVTEYDINQLVFTAQKYTVKLQLNDKREFDCIVKDVQFDPVTDKVIHFDLQALTSGEKISLEVPVLLTGQAVGVREGGQLVETLHKLHIECLPSQIPSNIEVDVTNLKLGKSITVADLPARDYKILNPADAVICSVAVPRGVELSAEGEEEIKEPEVISKGKDKEED
ncbi:MAG: 50S ribosomal protein L25 [Ignavibacteriaceae bacterium]|nr:50S ribosomal protein L25 [Ignavibacteriaceae bacterium]